MKKSGTQTNNKVISDLEKTCRNQAFEINRLTQTNQMLLEKNKEQEDALKEKTKKVDTLETENKSLTDRIKQLEEEIQTIRVQQDVLSKSNNMFFSDNCKLSDQARSFRSQNKNLRMLLNGKQIEITELRKEKDALICENYQLLAELSHLRQVCGEQDQEIKQLKAHISFLHSLVKSLEPKLSNNSEEKLTDLRSENKTLQNALHTLKKTIATLKAEVQSSREGHNLDWVDKLLLENNEPTSNAIPTSQLSEQKDSKDDTENNNKNCQEGSSWGSNGIFFFEASHIRTTATTNTTSNPNSGWDENPNSAHQNPS